MQVDRKVALGGLLTAVLILAYFVLSAVLQVVVLAITVAYVLYPLRQWLRERGLSRRVSSALATLTAFLVIVAIVLPALFAVYERRTTLIETLSDVPETIPVGFAGFEHEVEIGPLETAVEQSLRELAVTVAVQAPVLVLELALFTLVLYGILYRPRAVQNAMFGFVSPEYHDLILRLHRRIRTTLFSIYVIQAATAGGTFIIALGLFTLLGYTAPIWLAFIAGLLQFVPVVGPSVLILALAIMDVAVLDLPLRAVAVAVLGGVLIAMLPDVTIRPKLASRTGSFSSTLYFVGFVGGILTLGPIGFILGPLVIALVVEVVDILSEE